MVSGTVTEINDRRGLGVVTTADGRRFEFHVVEIADGSRAIDVGQPVRFRPLPKFGSWQAGELHKV